MAAMSNRERYAARLTQISASLAGSKDPRAVGAVEQLERLRAEFEQGGPLIVASDGVRARGLSALDGLIADRLEDWIGQLPQLLSGRPDRISGPFGDCAVRYEPGPEDVVAALTVAGLQAPLRVSLGLTTLSTADDTPDL